MLLFETLLVRGGYNSGVALKWPPCSTALKYFQYPAAEWDSSCLFSALAISILFSLSLSLSLPLSRLVPHLSPLSIYPSIHVAPGSSSRLPPPRVHSCLLVARTSLPTVNGPPSLLLVPKVRATAWNSRCLTRLDTSPFFILLLRSPAPFSKDSFHEMCLRAKRLLLQNNVSNICVIIWLILSNTLIDDVDFVT